MTGITIVTVEDHRAADPVACVGRQPLLEKDAARLRRSVFMYRREEQLLLAGPCREVCGDTRPTAPTSRFTGFLAGPCREVCGDWHDDPAKRRSDMYRLLA